MLITCDVDPELYPRYLEFYKSFHIIELFRDSGHIFPADGNTEISKQAIEGMLFFALKHLAFVEAIGAQLVSLFLDQAFTDATMVWWKELQQEALSQNLASARSEAQKLLDTALQNLKKKQQPPAATASQSQGNESSTFALMLF